MASIDSNNLPIIESRTERYQIVKFLGVGSFGRVVKCRSERTKRDVAVKILNDCSAEECEKERHFLQRLHQHSENYNFVQMFECFSYDGRRCMAFELLDRSLLQFCKENQMGIDDIRYVLAQLLAALAKLKQLGIIHTDIKMDNVMLVDHVAQPFRVKMIDFGCAMYEENAIVGGYGQVRSYRSPELMLGLPLTEKIDMWSLGCLTARLMLNNNSNLYQGSCEYDQLRIITETQGLPPNGILNKGVKTKQYFSKCNYVWRLKTPAQYALEQPEKYKKEYPNRLTLKCFDDIADINTPKNLTGDQLWADRFSRKLLVDLLKQMLDWDPDTRIVPEKAVFHRAIVQFIPPRILSELKNLEVPGLLCKSMPLPDGIFVHPQNGMQQPSQIAGGALRRPHPKPIGEKVRRC